MPVWPKSFYTIRADLHTAAMARRLRRPSTGVAAQETAWQALRDQLAATSYWKSAGVERGMTYAQFRTRVAPRDHASLAPAVARMTAGDKDVLWPGECVLFAQSAGTTSGRRRLMPATEALLAHYRAAGHAALLHYTARVGHAGVFRGRHLLVGGCARLVPLKDGAPTPRFAGDASGLAELSLPAWVERHLYEPGLAVAQTDDWPERLERMAQRTRGRDLSLIAGLPEGLLQLAHAVQDAGAGPKHRVLNLEAVWPNLECCVHTGSLLAPYHEELRALLGPSVAFQEVLAATEGILAAQDGEPGAGLRLFTDVGIFFEFLPRAEYDGGRLESLGPRLLPLAEVKSGAEYVVFVTTPGGLARIPLGDVVRFLSVQPPRVVWVGRTDLQLSPFGERLSEVQVTRALVAVCERQKWSIVNFHVAPLGGGDLTGHAHGRHEWWIELRPGTVATPTGPQMAQQLDAELLAISEDYAARRRDGSLDAPLVRLVMPGVFAHWLRYRQQWGGLHKVPRCRSDRLLADELSQVTNFASE
ncbi:MAG: GH3 auxin-responsive promoter family protein [Verrucomicrobia bacterium]|nr:GH3 auxin-responsive promoter family protein [Verrucomicrobiota bacterium]